MSRPDQAMHGARDGLFDVDGGVVVLIGERASSGYHEVAVENCARGVGDRVLLIVAFGQHRVERGDRTTPFGAVACAFARSSDAGRRAKHRGWIAARDRRLADGQCNFTLCHGIACQRIHDQQHMLALIAKIFGDSGGIRRTLQAHQRTGVGGCCNDDRTCKTFGAEIMLDEFFHFATALADQAD